MSQRYYSENDPELTIAKINSDELVRRRQVRGRDINDWHPTLRQMKAEGKLNQALALLHEIIASTEKLSQFDQREPDSYWFTQAAWLHQRLGEHHQAAAVLQRWLDAWPARRAIPWGSRPKIDRERARLTARIARLRSQA